MTPPAVVLLGGVGTRLRPLTYTRPKQALPIVEIPMIERVLGHLEEHGVTSAVLSLGYLHGAFTSLFPDGRFRSMEIRFAVEPEPLDTGGAVRFAAVDSGIDGRFLVVNGDVLTDLDVTAMLDFHDSRPGAEATIALAAVADSSAFGLVLTEAGSGRIEQFVEKPGPGKAGPGDVNAGTYVLEPKVLDRIAPDRRVSIEREVFPSLVANHSLFGFRSTDYWTDTGTPAQYIQAQLDILAGSRQLAAPVPGAVDSGNGVWLTGPATLDGEISGPSYVAPGATVAVGARVFGSVIGSGAMVEAGAVVDHAVILDHAQVLGDAIVRRSIVGAGAVVGQGASIVDFSMLGDGAKVGSAARLAGARMPDEPDEPDQPLLTWR